MADRRPGKISGREGSSPGSQGRREVPLRAARARCRDSQHRLGPRRAPPRPRKPAPHLENVTGHSGKGSGASLSAMPCPRLALVRVMTPTFIPPDALTMKGYEHARIANALPWTGGFPERRGGPSNRAAVSVSALVNLYGATDRPETLASDSAACPGTIHHDSMGGAGVRWLSCVRGWNGAALGS